MALHLVVFPPLFLPFLKRFVVGRPRRQRLSRRLSPIMRLLRTYSVRPHQDHNQLCSLQRNNHSRSTNQLYTCSLHSPQLHVACWPLVSCRQFAPRLGNGRCYSSRHGGASHLGTANSPSATRTPVRQSFRSRKNSTGALMVSDSLA